MTDSHPADDHYDPLDLANEGDERFGSYDRLTHAQEFKFVENYERAKPAPLPG